MKIQSIVRTSIAAVLLTDITMPMSTTSRAEIDITVIPLAAPAPVLVHVGANVGFTHGVSIDFGDGATKTWFDNGNLMPPFNILEAHEYNCPGTFTIQARVYNGDSWHGPDRIVQVGYPTPMRVVYGVAGLEVYLATVEVARTQLADVAVVDWGDGSDPKEFHWHAIDIMGVPIAEGPRHTYAASGDYFVTVTNHYNGPQCGLSQGSSLIVIVGNPNPVTPSTWGRVKAMYR